MKRKKVRCMALGCSRIERWRTLIGFRFCRQHWQEFYFGQQDRTMRIGRYA